MTKINLAGSDGRITVYVENDVQKFFNLPEWHEQRDQAQRIKSKNVQVMFNDLKLDHRVVITGVLCKDDAWEGREYKKGWVCKLDAHTRAEWWQDPAFSGNVPESLIVIQYEYDSLRELSESYFRHNSKDSVETAADKFRGIMKKMIDPETGKSWRKKSSPFQSGSIATLMNAAHVELFDFMYPGKNNRGMDSVNTDGVNTKSVLQDKLRRTQVHDFYTAIMVYDRFISIGQKQGSMKVIKDQAFGAAFLMYLVLHESEEYLYESIDDFIDNHMNKNVRNALLNHICMDTYKGDPQRVDKHGDPEIHMGYPVNRLIRDCQPVPEPHEADSIFHPTILLRLRFGRISEAVCQAFCDIMAIHNSGCRQVKLPDDVINKKCKILNKNSVYKRKSREYKSLGSNHQNLWDRQFSSIVEDDDEDGCYEDN